MDPIAPVALTVLREARGLSVPRLADLAGVGRVSVYDWEARRRMMGADDIQRIADALDLWPAERAALLAWAAERPAAGEGA